MGNEKSLPDHRRNSVHTTTTAISSTEHLRGHQQAHHQHHRSSSVASQAAAFSNLRHPHKRHSQPVVSAPAASSRSGLYPNRHSSPANCADAYRQSIAPSATRQRPPSRVAPSTTSSSAYSAVTLSTRLSDAGRAGKPDAASESKQTKYLKQQLYIKSYLDIVEQDRKARERFKAAKPGIRNYTPKILGVSESGAAATEAKGELDVWI